MARTTGTHGRDERGLEGGAGGGEDGYQYTSSSPSSKNDIAPSKSCFSSADEKPSSQPATVAWLLMARLPACVARSIRLAFIIAEESRQTEACAEHTTQART